MGSGGDLLTGANGERKVKHIQGHPLSMGKKRTVSKGRAQLYEEEKGVRMGEKKQGNVSRRGGSPAAKPGASLKSKRGC